MNGRSRWRTTICWFETPSRTRVGSPVSLKKLFRLEERPSTSVTSPSVMRPDGRSRLSAREMRPDEVWTAATKAPSRSRPTEPRGFFLERVRAIGRSLPCPYRTIRTEALEPVEVEIDQLLAGQHRHQAAEGQERRKRDAQLARTRAVLGHQPETDDRAHEEGDEQRGDHELPQIEPHHARELHVAHAHPLRVDEGGQEEADERPRAGDQQLGRHVGPER